MRMVSAIFALLLFAGALLAENPPTFPVTFYGVITTTGGTPDGQTLNAALGSSSASATVNPTSTYSCGASTCNYYLTISRASGDTTSTNVVFTLNSHNIGNGTFSTGAVVRLDFGSVPSSYLSGGVIGSASDVSASGTGTISATINGTTPGTSYDTTLPVNVSGGGNVLLSFNYDFSSALLNFSTINITNGTSGGKSYISVSGVNASGGQSGTKTLKMYGVSGTYNGICVKDSEGVSYVEVSSACTGNNETQVTCNGVAVSGITCSQSGTNLTISGLAHTAIIQFSVPAATTTTTTSSGGSNSGGGSTGGGGASTSTKNTTTVEVDIGSGKYCTVALTREISSSDNLSVLTTTLENKGGSDCAMGNFEFSDTIPALFANMGDITFSPQPTSILGWTAAFEFPSFAPGESQTITYSVSKWVPPSRVQDFTAYSLSMKPAAAPPAPQVITPPPEVKKPPVPTVPPTKPIVQPAAKPAQASAAPAPQQDSSGMVMLLIGVSIMLVVAILAFFVIFKKKKGL